LIAVLTVGEIVWVVMRGFEKFSVVSIYGGEGVNNTKALGAILYTEYVFAFEIAALLLLVAMIAAVGLTFRGTKKRKAQNISAQVKVQKKDRLKILKDV